MKQLEKTKKFLKKNMTSLIFFMILLVMVLVVILVVSVLMPTTRTSQYGDRLDGIETVEIKNSRIGDLEKKLNAVETVEKVDINIKGKIVNVKLSLSGTGTIDNGKVIATNFLADFSKEEIEFYDIQIFVTSVGTDGHTVIGYKTPKKATLSWTNN